MKLASWYSHGVLIAMLLFLPVAVVAQEKPISEDEFEKILSSAQTTSYSKVHRVTMTSKHFEKESGTTAIMEISEVDEFAGPGRERSRRITRDNTGTTDIEEIRIGANKYSRGNGRAWKKKDDVNSNKFTVFGTSSEPRVKREFTFYDLGRVNYGGKPAKVYESRKFRDYELSPDRHHAYTVIEKVWIQPDNTILRSESKTVEADGSVIINTTLEYEYPSSIDIRAPKGVK